MSDCIGPINIIPDNNQVVLLDNNKSITVIDNNCCTDVNVTQPITSVVQILTGPIGPRGEFPTSGSFNLTGSINVSGSISADYFNGGTFSGSFIGNFSGSTTDTLQDVTNNGNVTTLPITASSFYGNGLQIVGNATVTGSLTVSGSNTFRNIGPAQFTGSVDILGTVTVTNGITGSLLGTASFAQTASFVENAQTASYVLQAVSSSFATTASYYGGSVVSASYASNSTSASYAVSSSQTQNATSASYALSASYVKNAQTASSILGGKATHIPFFITDTTLATSSIYQSGSTSIIINQDNNTTANPEALYVWQPNTSSINVISGKGNLDNYLQLNIQNTNQGTDASSDIVATANNGSEVDNYIDMGINSENFAGFLGGPNDSYLYTHGHNFYIGNVNDGFQTFIFNSSSLQPIITLNSDNAEITGSLFGTASWAQNAVNANNATSASYALTASYASNVPATASFAISSSYAVTASYALNVPATASYAISASHALNADISSTAVSASHALNADNAINANYATTAGNGGVTQIIAGSGVTLLPPTGIGAVTVITTGGGGVTIISGSNVTQSFSNSSTWTFTHGLGVRTPIIEVFDSSYNQIIPQNIQLTDTASATITFPTLESGFAIASLGGVAGNSYSSSYSLYSTYADSASYYTETDPIFTAKSGSFATTGSNRFIGNQIITGSLVVSSSNTITVIGPMTVTGSLLVSGSTTQIGNNTLTGNTVLSGSIAVSGSQTFKGNMGLTGSLTISGSTVQIGNNTLLGNTVLSGSITISGSTTNTIIGNTQVYGEFNVSGSSTFNNSTFIVTGSQFFTGSSYINGSQTLTGNQIISGTLDVLGNINVISGSSFTRWGNKLFNYGAFSDYTTQTGSADTAHAIRFNTTDVALGVSLSGSSAMKIENKGIYNFQWSGQLNQGANAAVVSIWLRVNGIDVPGSRGDVTLASQDNALPAWNYVLSFNSNDTVELYWSSTRSTTSWIFSPVAVTPPRPSTASVIATITQIA